VTMQALAAAMAAIASGEVGARPVPLRYIVDTSKVLPLLEDPEVQARLLPLLPESQRTPAALRETVRERSGCHCVCLCAHLHCRVVCIVL